MDGKTAELIAQWWVDRMDDDRKQDNGESVQEAWVNAMSSSIGTPAPSIVDQQKAAFARQMTSILTVDGERIELIGVDYDPDAVLKDCLHFAGINYNPFPIKTWCRPNSLHCKIGYSGEWVPMFPGFISQDKEIQSLYFRLLREGKTPLHAFEQCLLATIPSQLKGRA